MGKERGKKNHSPIPTPKLRGNQPRPPDGGGGEGSGGPRPSKAVESPPQKKTPKGLLPGVSPPLGLARTAAEGPFPKARGKPSRRPDSPAASRSGCGSGRGGAAARKLKKRGREGRGGCTAHARRCPATRSALSAFLLPSGSGAPELPASLGSPSLSGRGPLGLG